MTNLGKSSKPISILVVDKDLFDSPEVQELKEKGHPVVYLNVEEAGYDVIIGRKCWRILPHMGKLKAYLAMMLVGVRSVKYPKEKV